MMQSVLGPIVRELQDLRLFKAARLFDDRVTALEWHPTIPNMAYCWYCCIDVNGPKKVMVMGDENGIASLLSLDGKELWTHSLHNGKMTHVEFFPGNDWWFCTASVDGTVKVWDLRKVTGEWDALHVLKHDSAVNVAHFSRTDGCRLLTSDQFNQIRVYRLPAWHLERKIERPSCFFQHDIPIKPSWYPLKDLIVVGRYPSNSVPSYPSSTENSCRNIDMIDIDTGKMQCLRALLWGRGQEE
ncbi:DNA damage-binding protein 2-like [Babylonia areolata]|uniref:DNA damage-binding protein 2-like n=1 Tax=Babylonia areolata TaxID=304850 RepID=UPI003FD0EB11